ncbi:MAG: SH3 domain-containing protein [Chloroflexi bacterium]|nr:SH3 domain-containing protein [Chloroflexota bacterium]
MLETATISICRTTRILAFCLVLVAGLIAQARIIPLTDGCTLDDAIDSANRDDGIDDCRGGRGPEDTIRFNENVRIRSRFPTITSPIIIEGNGHRVTLNDRPAFVIDGATLTLQNIRIRFVSLREEAILHIKNGKLKLKNASIENCTGGIMVENSTIEIAGDTWICGHKLDAVRSWFNPPPPPPQPQTCASVPGVAVTATYGLGSGVQCQRVGATAIANQYGIHSGYLDAVDVWAYAEQGVQVCIPHLGQVVFMDATTMPRSRAAVDAYSEGYRTCVSINRPGTIILVAGQPPPPKGEPVVAEPVVSGPVVDGCPARTTGHLIFRAEPSLDAEPIGIVLRGTTVGVVSRSRGWYQINHEGQRGWIGGRYVDNFSNC